MAGIGACRLSRFACRRMRARRPRADYRPIVRYGHARDRTREARQAGISLERIAINLADDAAAWPVAATRGLTPSSRRGGQDAYFSRLPLRAIIPSSIARKFRERVADRWCVRIATR